MLIRTGINIRESCYDPHNYGYTFPQAQSFIKIKQHNNAWQGTSILILLVAHTFGFPVSHNDGFMIMRQRQGNELVWILFMLVN